MAKYHGQGGRVYMSTSGGGTAVQQVALTSWSLDMPTDRVEVTSFEDNNKVYVQGKRDISGSLAGYYDDTDDSLFDAADSSTPVKMYLYPTSAVATQYFYGTAWVDASIEVGVDAAITVSGTFQAATTWTRKP
jgi:hypothetical protein